MRTILLIIVVFILVSSCKKDYYHFHSHQPSKQTRRCGIILWTYRLNGVYPYFRIDDLPGVALPVNEADFTTYKTTNQYCFNLCDTVTGKYTTTTNGYPQWILVVKHDVLVPVTQVNYDKYKVADLYCYP